MDEINISILKKKDIFYENNFYFNFQKIECISIHNYELNEHRQ